MTEQPLDETILDYLTNHGDTGAYVGDVWTDDDPPTQVPGVIRFDGAIDTKDLAEHITRRLGAR